MVDPKPVDYWDFFARECGRLNAPLYARLAEGVRGDEEIKTLASGARKGQPPSNVLLGAVHYLLLRGEADHALKAHYLNLNGGARADGDPFPLFQDFCRAYRAALEPLIATRVTNTNEVGRSAFLFAGFRALSNEAGEPLALVEIGPSAGLNLLWDRYGYRFIAGGTAHEAGKAGAAFVIAMPLRGLYVPPLGHPPEIASRVGLERNPVDLTCQEERDWLKALVWPDHIDRLARLEGALGVYDPEAAEIRAGDALELLPDALRAAPEDQTLCVYHTMAVYQFSARMKASLDDILTVAGLRRPVYRLSVEWDGERYPLKLARYWDGAKEERILAFCDPQGAWLEWLDKAIPA